MTKNLTKTEAISILNKENINFFTINKSRKIFKIENDNTLYKFLQRLEKDKIIKRLTAGKYLFNFKQVNDFSLANFLLTPSYISLESALSFYGILPQFPYSLTSVTPLKTKRIISLNKEFEYGHLNKKYFFSFIKKNNFLIASPEKALLDQFYFVSKKLRSLHFDDLDLSVINKKRFKKMSKEYNFLPLQKLIKKYKLC